MSENEINQGAELTRLSQLLFDRGVKLFYGAVIIECVAGLGSVIFSIFEFSVQVKLVTAVIGFLLLTIAYSCKILFENTYDNAETMRRQSVLNSGLGWPITKTQFSEWRCLAGPKILQEVEVKPLDVNYFATAEQPGAKRLLQMTQESAFWTRHLYIALQKWIWPAFIFSVFFFVLVVTSSVSGYIPPSFGLKIVYIVYLILPLILTLDILGWALRLGRIIKALKAIEDDLETLENSENLSKEHVLRLVAEYNCQIVRGFPIPGWFFRSQHDYIASLWAKR